MANKIRQYRFYNNKNGANKNYPSSITINNATTDVTYDYYTNGTVFENNFPILQLGIQAPPGTRFRINNGDYIIIGTTGIFELDLEGKTEITSLDFDPISMAFINANDNLSLIIDTIYDDGKE